MGIRGALFDKDGTLISFEKTWGPAIGAVISTLANGDAEQIAAQAKALHFSFEGLRFLPTSPIIAGSTGDYGRAWADALGRDDHATLAVEIDELTAIETLKSLTAIGEPMAVLSELRQLGVRSGIATNDSEASARRQAAALGVLEALDFVAGYDSGFGSKPGPGMIVAFAKTLGIQAGEVAMVGDTLHDIEAARQAGAISIAVLSGPARREALEPHADHVIADIGALPALIARLNN